MLKLSTADRFDEYALKHMLRNGQSVEEILAAPAVPGTFALFLATLPYILFYVFMGCVITVAATMRAGFDGVLHGIHFSTVGTIVCGIVGLGALALIFVIDRILEKATRVPTEAEVERRRAILARHCRQRLDKQRADQDFLERWAGDASAGQI